MWLTNPQNKMSLPSNNAIADADGDGLLDADEFKALFDLDGDGNISAHEAAKAAKLFAMVDKDGDGQLDIEELKQVRPAPLASAAAKLPSRVSRSQLPRRRHQDGARGQPSPRHFHHLVDVLMCVVSRPHRLQARGRPSSRLATPEGLYGLTTCAMVHAYSTREYMPVGVEAGEAHRDDATLRRLNEDD